MERVLVTGGLGFIGSHLADLFRGENYSVRILDLASRPSYLPSEIEYCEGSVTEKKSWLSALEGVDYVMHLAAFGDYAPQISSYILVNAAGTALMYETVVEHKLPVKKIIVASSQSVYGEGKYLCEEHGVFYPIERSLEDLRAGKWDILCPRDQQSAKVLPSEEEDKLQPVSPYGISKAAADYIALVFGRGFGIPSVALRYANVHGAHNVLTKPYPGAIKFFTEKALKGESIPMHEDGNQLRDFINVKDLGRVHLMALKDSAFDFQAFNVANGKSYSLRELAEKICEFAGAEFKPIFKNEFRPFTPRHWVVSPEKLKKSGWVPQYAFEDNVREFVEFFRKHQAN